MASTILSSINGQVLHRNSLAIVTDNWIVVRDFKSQSESLISIASVSRFKTFKTTQVMYLTCAAGCFLIASAALFSKQADGATLPFILVGLALLAAAQVTGQAALAFVIDSEMIRTQFGTFREAATVLAAVLSIRGGSIQSTHRSWLRAYLTLLV